MALPKIQPGCTITYETFGNFLTRSGHLPGVSAPAYTHTPDDDKAVARYLGQVVFNGDESLAQFKARVVRIELGLHGAAVTRMIVLPRGVQ